MATITISDSTYYRLESLAHSMSLPLDEYLNRLAAEGIEGEGSEQLAAATGTPEWMNTFDAWVASHPSRGFIADDSRDAVYGEDRDPAWVARSMR